MILLGSDLADSLWIVNPLAFLLLAISFILMLYQFSRILQITREYEQVFAAGATSLIFHATMG
jgi:hypothetical protein